MELRHLRYFVAVADEMHFTRAAAKLGIAQPPLTQQIQALQHELGVKLFERSGRGVALTDAGRAFLGEARSILAQVAAAVGKAKDAARGLVGRLQVGFTESASFHPLVTETLRTFQTVYPEVELRLREEPSTSLVSALGAGDLDLAFVRPPYPTHPSVQFELLAEEEMVAAVPADHPLAKRERLRLEDLSTERFILYPRAVRPGLSDEILEACRRRGFEPHVAQEAPQLSSTINLVATGMGVSIVPEGMRQVRPQAVCYLPIADLPVKASLGLAGMLHSSSPMVANFYRVTRGCLPTAPGRKRSAAG